MFLADDRVVRFIFRNCAFHQLSNTFSLFLKVVDGVLFFRYDASMAVNVFHVFN